MTRFRILPYKPSSRSAKAIAEALGGKRLRAEGSTFVPDPEDVIINWGRSSCPYPFPLVNACMDVRDMSNKLTFFQRMQEKDYVPRFWTTPETIPNEAFPIVCRRVLSGHSGAGIIIADTRGALVPCNLFVQYVKKKHEYRVHVGMVGDEPTLIAVQRKARRNDCDDPDWKVRNLAGGFIYKRNNINPPQRVLDVAMDCIASSGLDFGAVDVLWNQTQERAYVLEINTAPGLEGSTVGDYAGFFQRLAQREEPGLEGD